MGFGTRLAKSEVLSKTNNSVQAREERVRFVK